MNSNFRRGSLAVKVNHRTHGGSHVRSEPRIRLGSLRYQYMSAGFWAEIGFLMEFLPIRNPYRSRKGVHELVHFFAGYYFNLVIRHGTSRLFLLGTVHPVHKGCHDGCCVYCVPLGNLYTVLVDTTCDTPHTPPSHPPRINIVPS